MNADGEGPLPQFEQRPITDAQRTGRIITVPMSVRWLPYKPSSQQFKAGIKGRWQVANDYGWENADFTPTEYLHNLCWPDQPQ